MPLNERFPLAVTFVAARGKQKDGSTGIVPVGTGFVVNIPSRLADFRFEYIVTASHVVSSFLETFARFRTKDGGSKDLEIHVWNHHPHADVAITRLRGAPELHLLNIPVDALLTPSTDGWWRPNLGERVYFIGLLGLFEGMVERNVPMVRSGTIGALYQADVPETLGDIVRRMSAHLIDCRSYGGFSGSPCFFQRDDPPVSSSIPNYKPPPATLLLGLVSAHFDQWAKARLTGDLPHEPGSVESRVNTGVGLVTPTEMILEVLLMTELAEERAREEREQLVPEAGGDTLDESEEAEYDRFERLARQNIAGARKEIEEQRLPNG